MVPIACDHCSLQWNSRYIFLYIKMHLPAFNSQYVLVRSMRTWFLCSKRTQRNNKSGPFFYGSIKWKREEKTATNTNFAAVKCAQHHATATKREDDDETEIGLCVEPRSRRTHQWNLLCFSWTFSLQYVFIFMWFFSRLIPSRKIIIFKCK